MATVIIKDEDDKAEKPKSKKRSLRAGAARGYVPEHARPSGLGSARIEPEREKRGTLFERKAERRVPSVDVMKKYPDLLESAIRRGQVKLIAKNAPPGAKDTDDTFTMGGKRYVKTGVYEPSLAERLASARRGATSLPGKWWEKNKTTVVVGGLSAFAALLMFNAWRNAQQKNKLARAHALAATQHAQLAASPRVGWGGQEPGWYSDEEPGYYYAGWHGGW